MATKPSELIGPALDWAVEKAAYMGMFSGTPYSSKFRCKTPKPYSTDWAQGGPIIEQEGIALKNEDGVWHADTPRRVPYCWFTGPTALIAAMRCYVASKLGDGVEIPEGLQ